MLEDTKVDFSPLTSEFYSYQARLYKWDSCIPRLSMNPLVNRTIQRGFRSRLRKYELKFFWKILVKKRTFDVWITFSAAQKTLFWHCKLIRMSNFLKKSFLLDKKVSRVRYDGTWCFVLIGSVFSPYGKSFLSIGQSLVKICSEVVSFLISRVWCGETVIMEICSEIMRNQRFFDPTIDFRPCWANLQLIPSIRVMGTR